jgi:hypothetical protein
MLGLVIFGTGISIFASGMLGAAISPASRAHVCRDKLKSNIADISKPVILNESNLHPFDDLAITVNVIAVINYKAILLSGNIIILLCPHQSLVTPS